MYFINKQKVRAINQQSGKEKKDGLCIMKTVPKAI